MVSFIVYGTLRPGGGAEHLWADRAVARRATLAGYELLDTGRGYPIVLPCATAGCVVDVLTVHDEAAAAQLLAELDRYEEVPDEYVRVNATAVADDGECVAGWLYVGVADVFEQLEPIPSGDWLHGGASPLGRRMRQHGGR